MRISFLLAVADWRISIPFAPEVGEFAAGSQPL
jgi:hypothetical protein